MISLHILIAWLKGNLGTFEKMPKRNIFVQNRLQKIGDLTKEFKITFRYITGKLNPADCVSRPMTYKQVTKYEYFQGLSYLQNLLDRPDIEVTIPTLVSQSEPVIGETGNGTDVSNSETQVTRELTVKSSEILHVNSDTKPVISVENFSSFPKLVRVMALVFKFISKLKSVDINQSNLTKKATDYLVSTDQQHYFKNKNEFNFFATSGVSKAKIPNLILQMNLFLDDCSVHKMKSKFMNSSNCLILLHLSSYLTKLLVLHIQFIHARYFISNLCMQALMSS